MSRDRAADEIESCKSMFLSVLQIAKCQVSLVLAGNDAARPIASSYRATVCMLGNCCLPGPSEKRSRWVWLMAYWRISEPATSSRARAPPSFARFLTNR